MIPRWITIAYLAYLVAPIALLVTGSFGDLWLTTLLPTGATFKWYADVAADPSFRRAFTTSLFVAAMTCAACVAVCGPSQQWNATTQQCEVVCSEGTSWDAASGTCKLDTANVHAAYFSAFSDTALANGPAVTAECIKCHEADAAQMAGAAHFKWLGPTPDLLGHEAATDFAGKKNLINNFCVAVASNETRCTQCHAGYGDPGTATTAGTPGYELTALSRVDCLICHADMATGYIKATANWGAADVAVVPTLRIGRVRGGALVPD